MTTRFAPRLVLALALVTASPVLARGQAVQARAGGILRASGTVEVQHGPQAPWTPARSGQQLLRGDTLRTFAVSVAQIIFTNAVQWQLSAESQLNLEEALAGGSASIVVRLEQGGAVSRWTPDRRTGNAKMIVKTSGGQASITGTEWSMRVDEDGRTALVVLEGSVELSNERGSVTVHQNEAGEMRPGQPPSVLRLISPQDRVQWVASYVASPARYATGASPDARIRLDAAAADATAGRTAEAIDRLERSILTSAPDAADSLALADLLLAGGEFSRARTHAEAGRARFAADARFDAMLARIALFDDRPADSRAAADAAIAKDARGADGWIALGDWAYREGDAPVAERAFSQATAVAPQDARGWFGRGTVATEREELTSGRRLLGRALEIDPQGSGYRGQLGTLETLANNMVAAEREYGRALDDRSDDYVALTGAALLALKQGHEAGALDLLTRATLLEPRYARAQIYLGVAYYRLRRVDAALKALERATMLDPRDPLPYMMLTQIYTDAYEPWKAVEAARAAQARMPYLKSLNQLATTPKGSANLGNAMAFFGIEQWAQHLAQESYYPYWAGSHLFLGDRYAGPYAKTSEYFQGLAADATVLGGSPGYQTLLTRPGHYLTLPFMAARNRFDGLQVQRDTVQPELSLNGYANAWRPIAYALNFQTAPAASGTSTRATTSSWAGSIGIRPTPAWSLFTVVSAYKSDYSTPGLQLGATSTRIDGGAQYRGSPTSTLTIKAGTGTVDFTAATSDPVATLGTGGVSRGFEIQHAFSIGARHQVSWGVELAQLPTTFNGLPLFGLLFDGTFNDHSEVAYVSERLLAGTHLQLDAEIVVTAVTEQIDGTSRALGISDSLPPFSSVRPRPRVGAVVRFAPGRLLRLAYQATTTPLGAQDTLGPVATAGIPLDETVDNQLGDIARYRAQMEWQWSPRTFTLAFVDHKHVGDLTSERDPFVSKVSDYFAREPLARLRNQLRDVSQLNVSSPQLLEDTVAAKQDSDVWVAGLGLNQVLSTQLSLASHYYWTRSATRPAVGPSARLPYYPDHAFSVGATWVSPRHVYLSASAMYRTERTGVKDSARFGFRSLASGGVDALDADWTGMVAGSWETPNKRWSLELLATDLFATAKLHGDPRQPSVSVTIKHRR